MQLVSFCIVLLTDLIIYIIFYKTSCNFYNRYGLIYFYLTQKQLLTENKLADVLKDEQSDHDLTITISNETNHDLLLNLT